MLTITLEPAGKGYVTATSTDGHSFQSTTPLCNGARYWLDKGADPATTIVTVWSSGPGDWSLKSTVGYAARRTVREDDRKPPHFVEWRPFVRGKLTEALSS